MNPSSHNFYEFDYDLMSLFTLLSEIFLIDFILVSVNPKLFPLPFVQYSDELVDLILVLSIFYP